MYAKYVVKFYCSSIKMSKENYLCFLWYLIINEISFYNRHFNKDLSCSEFVHNYFSLLFGKKTCKFVFKIINFIITLVWKYVDTLIYFIHFVIWQVTWYIVFSVPKSFIILMFSLHHLVVIKNSSYWRYGWMGEYLPYVTS